MNSQKYNQNPDHGVFYYTLNRFSAGSFQNDGEKWFGIENWRYLGDTGSEWLVRDMLDDHNQVEWIDWNGLTTSTRKQLRITTARRVITLLRRYSELKFGSTCSTLNTLTLMGVLFNEKNAENLFDPGEFDLSIHPSLPPECRKQQLLYTYCYRDLKYCFQFTISEYIKHMVNLNTNNMWWSTDDQSKIHRKLVMMNQALCVRASRYEHIIHLFEKKGISWISDEEKTISLKEDITVEHAGKEGTNISEFTICLENVNSDFLCQLDNSIMNCLRKLSVESNDLLKIKYEMCLGAEKVKKVEKANFERKDSVWTFANGHPKSSQLPTIIFETGSLPHSRYLFKTAYDNWVEHCHTFFHLKL